MNKTNNTPLFIVFIVIIILFLFFSGGAMTGTMMTGGMMGNGTMGGLSWMWLPTIVTLGIGILLGWAIFRKK